MKKILLIKTEKRNKLKYKEKWKNNIKRKFIIQNLIDFIKMKRKIKLKN